MTASLRVVLLTLIASLLAGSAALAQPGRTDVRPGPAPLVVGPHPDRPYPAQPQVAASQPWDCWFVSSRACDPTDLLTARPCTRYYHYRTQQRLAQGSLAQLVASLDPNRPVCIFVHGGYYNFGDVLHESRVVDNWLKTGGPVPAPQLVCFTWPADTPIPLVPADVMVLGRRAAIHGAFLAEFVNRLPPRQPVSLMGHSFGARTIAAALQVLGGGILEEVPKSDYGDLVFRRLRGILLLPAIDHHWFNPGERYALAPVGAERILIMTNSVDPLLPFYPLRTPFSQRAMGYGGLGRSDRRRIDPSLGSRIDEFDIARISGLKHNLDAIYEHPELARVAAPYVSFTDLRR